MNLQEAVIMDPDAFTASLFKWDPRSGIPPPARLLEAAAAAAAAMAPPPPLPPLPHPLAALLQPYGIRYFTAAKIAELGFTINTLLDMRDEELDEMMDSLSHIFRYDLLVGEKYGIKAAVRAERRRLDEEDSRRRGGGHLLSGGDTTTHALDALSHEGLSEEPVQQEKEAAGSGGGGGGCGGNGGPWEVEAAAGGGKKQRRKKKGRPRMTSREDHDDEADHHQRGDHYQDDDIDGGGGISGSCERQREHPFIVTEPGEVARGKKNGLDYLFHLYEQCREFLIQVQNIAKERGEKCPTKVTNQVFRYAKKAGASYINKPKMRHYVHCYALHCLDEEASNALRRAFKERGENVGAWRQACYKPLVVIAAAQGWDIDAVFNAHPRLSIWYVPTKLRQLCHAERSNLAASSSVTAASPDHLPF